MTSTTCLPSTSHPRLRCLSSTRASTTERIFGTEIWTALRAPHRPLQTSNSMSPTLPTFAGELTEDYEAWECRLRAFVRLQSNLSEAQKLDWILLALPPGTAAATCLRSLPTSSFDGVLQQLREAFNNRSRADLGRAALFNELHLRRFRDPEHPHELVGGLLDAIDRLGSRLQLSDIDLREALTRCASVPSLLKPSNILSRCFCQYPCVPWHTQKVRR